MRVRINPGSALVSRTGFGVSPKQSYGVFPIDRSGPRHGKVRDREDAITSTGDACVTQISPQ
jgi:hypothetical protein